ncbi:MAG TPA: hypothetical protein VMP01_01650 [Pirellulaceae bacterium]|nr:hypothetical protein [Pirellulaceae bacterium]
MRTRIFIGAAACGSIPLILIAVCIVVAQTTQFPRSRTEPRPRPETDYTPVPARNSPIEDHPFATLSAGDAHPGSYSGAADTPSSSKRATAELRNGLKLDGQLSAGAIPGQFMFGAITLPIHTIRGLRLSDEVTTDEGGQSHPTNATIILENGDSLTGVLRLDSIRLQTEWGEAVVKLTHLRSVILTTENATWQEHEGRWRLAPVESTPSETRNDGIEAAGGLNIPDEADTTPSVSPLDLKQATAEGVGGVSSGAQRGLSVGGR